MRAVEYSVKHQIWKVGNLTVEWRLDGMPGKINGMEFQCPTIPFPAWFESLNEASDEAVMKALNVR